MLVQSEIQREKKRWNQLRFHLFTELISLKLFYSCPEKGMKFRYVWIRALRFSFSLTKLLKVFPGSLNSPFRQARTNVIFRLRLRDKQYVILFSGNGFVGKDWNSDVGFHKTDREVTVFNFQILHIFSGLIDFLNDILYPLSLCVVMWFSFAVQVLSSISFFWANGSSWLTTAVNWDCFSSIYSSSGLF